MSIDRAKAMQAAQKFLAKGQLDKAIVEYEKLVQSDPKDARTLLKLGDLYTRQGANKEASATYRKVAEQYADQGFFLKAVAVCKQILKLDPGQLDVWEKLAEMYELLSLVNDALTTYEQVADAHMRAGNARKAVRAYEKIANLDPENVAARIRYAEALSKLNKTVEAATAFLQGAELLKSQGRLDDYLKVGERLLYHQADNYDFARDLAAAYLDRNDAKSALAKLQVCFNADPHHVTTLRLLARAFEQLGQVQKSVSVLKEVARVHANEARPGEQGSVLRKILALDPNDGEAKRELSQLGRLPGRGESSATIDVIEEDYDEILVDDEEPTQRKSGSGLLRGSMPPSDEQRRATVARMLSECDVFMRYGLHDKMITQLSQVLDIDSRSIEARAKLKEVYLKTKRVPEAVTQLIMLAELLADTDVAAARDHLREALHLDPSNEAVEQRLDELLAAQSAADEDDIIVLDDGAEGEFSDVTFESPSQTMARPEESFASVVPGQPSMAPPSHTATTFAPQAAPQEDDDEPEMIVEEGDEDDPELILEDDDGSFEQETLTYGQAAAEPADDAELSYDDGSASTIEPDEAISEELAEALEEVDFYLKQELAEEARETLVDALETYPNHPALLRKLAQVDALEAGGSAEPAGERPEEDDNAFALAQKLADEDELAQAPKTGAGAGPIDVADVIAQFKQGVAKQVDKDDSATHHDLGIAYMEMGLHAEAIDEFKLCLNDPTRTCTAHTMIGMSYVSKGDMEAGIDHLKLALTSNPNREEELGLCFEIGNAHELLGKNMEALVWYEKVEEKDPSFRDVAQRIERLGTARTPEQEADEFDEMFDNMILKD